MGPAGILLGLGGSAVAGTAWGLKSRGDDALLMDADVQRDLDSLRGTGSLPQGVQPRFSLTPHHQRGIVSRYALGIGLGGFGAWLLTLVIALAVIDGTGQEGAAAEKVIPSLMVAALVGCGGFIIPGLLIGAWLWIRESRARVREATAEVYRAYWSERERGAQALAQGQATPDQVVEVLSRFHTDSVPDFAPEAPSESAAVAGQWVGEVGQPLTIAAEVEQVGTARGWEDPSRLYSHYYLRTGERDILSWQARQNHGLQVGDVVTIEGHVKAHVATNVERITEVWYCQIVGDVVRPPEG